MALLTDGIMATLTDLKACESSILDMASIEAIDLTSKLALAQRELTLEVTSFLVRRGYNPGRDLRLDRVAVTEALLHAHITRTLSITFRDASNSQLNDRYTKKWNTYANLAKSATQQLFDVGIGIVNTPVGKAGMPIVMDIPGGLLPATTYYVNAAGVNSTGQTGTPSESVILQCLPGTRLQVQPVALPVGAIGWIISAGIEEDSMLRQNDALLNAGDIWIQPAQGLRSDLPSAGVQEPDFYIANRRELLRG
ncbi:MAG: hypothetical protein H7Y20_14710 [Bryobacteraceae bacterium]|nr:hypothetical protein [Bryobacteraceae bacterium]